MQYENLLVENRDGIVVLTINRPKALNALNRQTLAELRQFFGKDALAIEGLKGVGGTVLRTSFDKSKDDAIRAALSAQAAQN
jgi:enoyl-CoA hydratase